MRRWGPICFAVLALGMSSGMAAPAFADDPATTTTATTTDVTTTTVATTTTATVAPAPPPPPPLSLTSERHSLRAGCPTAAVVVAYPNQTPLFLAPPAGKALLRSAAGVTASVGRVDEASCRGAVVLRSVSLFGSIAAKLVRVSGTAPSVDGLAVGGVTATRRRYPLGWGTLVVGARTPTYVAALALTLSRPHGGLPAGTSILVGVAPVPPKPKIVVVVVHHAKKQHHKHKKRRRHKATHQPLSVTPKLGAKQFDFPVVGDFGVGDSYGAGRSDVPGGWHHGDDLFAPLGTPVVAVVSGTINRVGWERLGGWRLWVRDAAGDQFYYAHLSGYAPDVLHSKRVERGDVIGFVGNTGDAFSTPPHLHFEIHPRPLLHLAYDGAVDPTSYLEAWPHVDRVTAPTPAHPRLPRTPTLRSEAKYVWRELLVARHLVRAKPAARPKVNVLASADNGGAVASGPIGTPANGDAAPFWLLFVPFALLAAAALAAWFRRDAATLGRDLSE